MVEFRGFTTADRDVRAAILHGNIADSFVELLQGPARNVSLYRAAHHAPSHDALPLDYRATRTDRSQGDDDPLYDAAGCCYWDDDDVLPKRIISSEAAAWLYNVSMDDVERFLSDDGG
jgi:hypothetical protein